VSEERARWQTRYSGATPETAEVRAPSAWVIEQCLALPGGFLLVDVAAGLGRHAVALAERGRRVVALDFVEDAVRVAVRRAWGVSGEVWALVADAGALPFADGSVDAILTVNFLDRALFPTFARLLRPGGRLVVETYTHRHADLVSEGRARAPRNPAYMLEPGELPRLVAPLRVVASREALVNDDAGERWVASVVAERD
jgi:SAM-dependent methyltransferase